VQCRAERREGAKERGGEGVKARASWIWHKRRVGGGDRECVAADATMMQRACRTGWESVVGMQGVGGEGRQMADGRWQTADGRWQVGRRVRLAGGQD
jgi:hypothetical protein